MSRNLPSSSGLMKSTLRDTMKRLRNVRVKAGKNDEAEKQLQSTGDPYRDKSNEFLLGVKKAKDLINERNTGMKKNGNDRTTIEQSNEIRKEIRHLQALGTELQVMVGDAERQLARENRKKKPKQEKLKLLERQLKERESSYKQCMDMLEGVKNMDAQRLGDTKGRAGVNPGDQTAFGAKAKLRQQLNLNSLKKAAVPKPGEAGGDVEMGEGGGGSTRLEDDPETKEQMKALAQQEAEINRGLDRLRGNIGRLGEVAREIGAQLDMQNAMLDSTEGVVDKQTKQLKGINRRLNKVLKVQSPMNTFITVACIFLLLALVGFFLMEFGVV